MLTAEALQIFASELSYTDTWTRRNSTSRFQQQSRIVGAVKGEGGPLDVREEGRCPQSSFEFVVQEPRNHTFFGSVYRLGLLASTFALKRSI